ncbi:MAG: hypothetical protein U9M92_02920 [Patescibacteria group bacterium]|nr:hypothetical protein [Patescibacteria group bacterium]
MLAIYTWHTRNIAKEAIKANQIGSRSVLTFLGEYLQPFKFTNVGNGPAFNIVIIRGNPDGVMLLSSEGMVVGNLPVGGIGSIKQTDLNQIDKDKIKQKLPYARNLIEELFAKESNSITLVYQDLFGNKFASVISGVGGDYSEAFEFKELE